MVYTLKFMYPSLNFVFLTSTVRENFGDTMLIQTNTFGHNILLRKVPYYFAAREGKTQSRNEKHILSLSKKKTKWRTDIREGFACPIPHSKGPIFAKRGRVISGRLANRFGSRFGTNTKLLRGVIGPVSTSNYYSGQKSEAPKAPDFERFIISSRAKRVYRAWC